MIRGTCIGLRAIEQDDLTQMLAWRNLASMRRFFRETRELSMEHQERWYQKVVLADPSTRMWSVVSLASGELCGAGGLCCIDWVSRGAELSLYIGVEGAYIDDKLAPDAAQAIVSHGFIDLGLERIWCEAYDFDTAKCGLLGEAGFQREATLRSSVWSEGRRHDSHIYAVLATEWTNRGGKVQVR